MSTFVANKLERMKRILLMISICLVMMGVNAQFTAGNIVVMQVGDGSIPLANTGNTLVLNQYTTSGTIVSSTTIPSTGGTPLVTSGNATSEGALSLSDNDQLLVFSGYAQSLPNATALSGSSSATINRGVGTVNAAGNYVRQVVSSTFFSGNNIRSASSDGVNNFWASGGNTGTAYYGLSTTEAILQSSITNTRCVNVVNNNLYFSTGSGTTGIYQVGTGLPVTSGQTNTQIINCTGTGVGTPSPYAFYFNPAMTICYVADDRSIANGGGIQKWVFSGSWTLAYTLGTGGTVGARGVIADFSGANPIIYATTAEASSNRVISIVDAGAGSLSTTLATASTANTIFRGIAFAPITPTPTVNLSVSTTSASEAGATVVMVRATSSSIVGTSQTVNLGVTGAGITAGDYNLSNSTITINAGFDTGSVSFTIVDDAAIEGTETATLTISSPTSGLTLGSTTSQNVTIADNDSPPTPTVGISLSANAGTEAGTTVITVTATASSTLGTTETVNVGVSGSGITAGDYTLSNSTITINSGSNSGFVTFTIVDDALVEGTETATISISSPSSGIILGSPTSDVVAITDNDFTPPTVHFTSLHQSVLENVGTANVGFTMTTSANPNPCKIIVTTSVHTTATGGGVDYTISNDTVTFPGGSNTPQSLVVNINNDVIAENAEYVSFKVSSIINGTLGANQYHILYIRDNDYTPPTATNEVMLQLLGSFSNGAEGTNSAEIVAYDSASQKLVIANSIGKKIDFINFSNPSSPSLITSIDVTALGNVNSVAVRNGIVAVALENLSAQSNGKILFYNTSGTLISQVDVGAMPDMITFNNAGNKVLAACEGEPNDAYTIDPEGTIAVVDISGGVATVTNANVTMINFNAYNSQASTLRAAGVRIYGPSATVSQDFEPEYITVSDDDLKAWVVLQENNAIAVIDLLTNTVTQILPLGTTNHMSVTNGMDASDQSSGINIANYPVKGMYLPDGLTHINIGGTNYLITANEGDSRAWTGMNEESRISGLTLDPTAFVDQNILKSNFMLGRLNATNKTGDTDNDGDIDEIHVYGGRGFSIWTETGTLVYNSGNLMEKIIASHPTFAGLFNANHLSGAIVTKNRSDDKGVEPEGVAVAYIDGDAIAFVSCERLGGVFLFNIDNPSSPRYVGYYNNRSIPGNNPDRGAEGIVYIKATASPNGNDLLILANEVSSTLSIFQINTCASASGVDVNYTPNDSICVGQSVTFSTPSGTATAFQWLNNNANIGGATGTSTIVSTAGNYSLAVANTSLLCTDTTEQVQIVVNTLPTVSGSVDDNTACVGQLVTFTGSGASTYTWNGGITNGTPISAPATGTYTVTGTAATGCSNTATVSITTNALPTVVGNVTDNTPCVGQLITFSGGGASTYIWTGGINNATPMVAPVSGTYTVTGTNTTTGCSNTATVTITTNTLPIVSASVTDNDFCEGTSVTFNGSGANSYSWSGSVLDGVPTAPSASGTYTVTGTNTSTGCSNSSTVSITVHALPVVIADVTDNNICTGSSVIFTGSGATSYTWTSSVVDGIAFTPVTTATYTVTGTDGSSCSNTATITVTVNNLPTVLALVTDNNICLGDGIVFNGSGASSYSWTGGVLNGSSYTPSATGTYTVTGTDLNSCSNTATVTVTVNNLPNVSLNLVPDIYCVTNSAFNIPGAAPAGGSFTGTGVTGSQFDPSIGLGSYTITYTYTDGNGCTNSDNDNLLVVACAGIEDETSTELLIYPNPTEDYFYIKSSIPEIMNIRIMDIHGKIIYNSKVSNQEMVDVSTYAAGAYVVELTYLDQVFRNRLVIK